MRMTLNQCLNCGDLFEHVEELYFCDKCWMEMQVNEEIYREYRREALKNDPFCEPFDW